MADSSQFSSVAAQLTDEQLVEIAQRRGLTLKEALLRDLAGPDVETAAPTEAKERSYPQFKVNIVAPTGPAPKPLWGKDPPKKAEEGSNDVPPKEAPKAMQIQVVTSDATDSKRQTENKSNLLRYLQKGLKSGDLGKAIDKVSSETRSRKLITASIHDNRKSLAKRLTEEIKDGTFDGLIEEVQLGTSQIPKRQDHLEPGSQSAEEQSNDAENKDEKNRDGEHLTKGRVYDPKKKDILKAGLLQGTKNASLKRICAEITEQDQHLLPVASERIMSKSRLLKNAFAKATQEGLIIDAVQEVQKQFAESGTARASDKKLTVYTEEDLAAVCEGFKDELHKPWPKNAADRKQVMKMRFLSGLSDGKLDKVFHRVAKKKQDDARCAESDNQEVRVEKLALKESVKQAFAFAASNRALKRTMVSVGLHFGIGLAELNLQKKLVSSLFLGQLDDICSMVIGNRTIQDAPMTTLTNEHAFDVAKKIDLKRNFVRGVQTGNLQQIVTHVIGDDQVVSAEPPKMLDLLKESLISGITSGALDDALSQMPREHHVRDQIRPAIGEKKKILRHRFEQSALDGELARIIAPDTVVQGSPLSRSWWRSSLPRMLGDGRLDAAILDAKLNTNALVSNKAVLDDDVSLVKHMKKKLIVSVEDEGLDEIVDESVEKKSLEMQKRRSHFKSNLLDTVRGGGLDDVFLNSVKDNEKDWSTGFVNLSERFSQIETSLQAHRDLLKVSLLGSLRDNNLDEILSSCKRPNAGPESEEVKLAGNYGSEPSSNESVSDTATSSTEYDLPISTMKPGDFFNDGGYEAQGLSRAMVNAQGNSQRLSLFNSEIAKDLLGGMRSSLLVTEPVTKYSSILKVREGAKARASSPIKPPQHVSFQEVEYDPPDPGAVGEYINFMLWRFFVKATPPKVNNFHRRIPGLANMLNRLHMIYKLESEVPDVRRKNKQLLDDTTMSVYEELFIQKRVQEAQQKADILDRVDDLTREIEVTQTALSGLVAQFPDVAPRCAPKGEWPPPCRLTQQKQRIPQEYGLSGPQPIREYRPTSPIRNPLFPVASMTTVLRSEPALKEAIPSLKLTGDTQHLRKALVAAKDSVDQEEREENITLDSSRMGDTGRDSGRYILRDKSNSPSHKAYNHQEAISPPIAGEVRLGLTVFDKFHSTSSRLIVAYVSIGSFASFEGDAIVNASQWPKIALDSENRGWDEQGTKELCAKYADTIRDIDSRGASSVGLLLLDSSILQSAWSMENVARLGCGVINEALVRSSHIQEVHFLAKNGSEAEAISAGVAATFRCAPVAFSPSPRSKTKVEKWMKNPLAPSSFRDFPDLDPPKCPKVVKNEKHPWRPAKRLSLMAWHGLSAGGTLAEMNLKPTYDKRGTLAEINFKLQNLRPSIKHDLHSKPFR